MKKFLAGLIAVALACTAVPVYATEGTEAAGDGALPAEAVCLEESEAGEDLPDSDGWSLTEERAQTPKTLASSSGNVVVVLDPGHDSTHSGAQYGGLSEETLNLKIAQYCKAELEEYQGVTVYMTRTTEACPYPGKSNSDDLAGRVDYAASVGATVYVSLHLNANDNTSATGAQVYCPNTNYNASVSTQGFALADKIMAQLTALGLENRGIYSVNSQSGTTYPDGSTADYYAVIRRSKLAGFPGIIVEHAFLSNTSDRDNYLSSEASLKRLGVADATGIAQYFGLQKGTADIEQINGTWTYTIDGVPDYTYTGVAHNSNGWWYVENGVVNFDYTGFGENGNGKWYCENGKVNFDVNGVIRDATGAIGEAGTWYYVVGSEVQTSYTGVADYSNENGWWYIKNGVVDFTANTVARNKNGWWYVADGKVDFSYNGFAENSNGKWYCENGKVNFDVNGVIRDATGAIGEAGTWYYVVGSEVQTSYTGVADYSNENGWWYIKNGVVDFTANTVARNKNGWWYVLGGKVQFDHTGLADYSNENGWWYIADGKVDFSYEGFGENRNGKWYLEDGKVKFDKNSVIKDIAGAIGEAGTWYYVVGSEVQTGFTGLANYKNENGWWYIQNGVVDFTANTVANNENGWWYVENGKVDFTYNGIAQNENGWWYIAEGKVDFSYNGEVTVSGETYQVESGQLAGRTA